MKVIQCLCLIVLTTIPLIINQVDCKVIYVGPPKLIDSIVCVGISFYFEPNGLQTNGDLVVRLIELNEDGEVTNWVTEVERISLSSGFAGVWTGLSRTVRVHQAEVYAFQVLHDTPNDVQATEVLLNVTINNNECPPESLIPTTLSLPPVTRWPVDSFTELYVTQSTRISEEHSTTPEPSVSVHEDQPTEQTIKESSTSSVTGQTDHSTLGLTSLSTTDRPTQGVSTTSHEPTEEEATTITPNYNEGYQTDISQSINYSLTDLTQSEPPEEGEKIELNTEPKSVGIEMITTIKFLANGRFSIASIFGLVGVLVIMISLTIIISNRKRQNYRPTNRDLVVSSTANGIDLNMVTIYRQSMD